MLRLTPSQAKKHGLGGKVRREDRKARVFDTTNCGWLWVKNANGAYRTLNLTLPFPPSVNGYWRNYKGHTTLSLDGKAYRAAVLSVLAGVPSFGDARLRVEVLLFPPSVRRLDVDNFPKGIFDSLTHAKVWDDDSQIDVLNIRRCEVRKPGRAVVIIDTI